MDFCLVSDWLDSPSNSTLRFFDPYQAMANAIAGRGGISPHLGLRSGAVLA